MAAAVVAHLVAMLLQVSPLTTVWVEPQGPAGVGLAGGGGTGTLPPGMVKVAPMARLVQAALTKELAAMIALAVVPHLVPIVLQGWGHH